MTSRHALKVKTTKAIGNKVNKERYQHALLGHPDGTLTITDKPGYGWARLGGQPGRVVQVYLRGVLPAYDLPVVVSKLQHRPQDYGVVDLDVGGFAGTASGETGSNGWNGTAYMSAHASQHAYLGGDQTFTHLRQWRPLRVYASGGLNIGVEQGFIYRAGARVNVSAQTIDLTSHLPSSGARYVLITLNAAGTLTATDGSDVATPADLTLANIPATPGGNFPLAAVRCFLGQTSIRERRTAIDIIDLRWPQEVSANTRSGVTVITSNTTLSALHDIVIVSNGSTITLPTAVGAVGVNYNIIRSGTSNVLINTTSSQTISGDLTLTLTGQWDSVVVVSDGSNWVRCS